jgi:tetratricopeptide (TPR) repeat protein
MLTDIQVFQSLETALPPETRAVVARRMRRVEPLWKALHDEAFLKKAVSFAGADSERWRPGLLGLLLASETDYLRVRFAKGGSSAVKIPDAVRARAETELQRILGRPDPDLDQASLAALALVHGADSPSSAAPLADAPSLVLSCLYSIAPDSTKVIERLADRLPGSASALLEVLLANEPAERTNEILARCVSAGGLPSAAALCEAAAAQGEQELAQRLGTAVAAAPAGAASADDPEKGILRARMLRLAGEPAAALPEADAARKNAKRMLLDTLMESARAAEEEKNFTTALSFWQEAGALSPNAAGIRAGIARSLSGLGRVDEALAALPSTTENADDLLLLARIHAKSGAREKAVDAARRSYANSHSDPLTNMELAGVLAECGDPRGAAQILAAVSRTWPNHPQVFSRLADLYAQIGDWHACAAAASSAWHLHPEDNQPLRLLALSAERENRMKDAVEYYRLLSGRAADDPSILLALAQASLAAGDSALAHQSAERTLALQPDCGEAHAILGLIDLAQGKEENAFAALQKATRLAPKASAPWKALAEMHSAKGNREAAATTLRAGIESASDPVDLLLALGRNLLGEGRLREAGSTLERALALRPNDTDILIALAQAALEMQQNAEAEEYLNRALAICPALAEAAKKLASLLESLGRFAEARAVLERAVAADPQSPELLIELGALLLGQLRRSSGADCSLAETALAFLLQAAELLGDAVNYRLQCLIGWARIFAGQLPEAISLFGALLQAIEGLTIEQKVDAHTGLAEALQRSGDFPTAIHNLQAALQISPADAGIRKRLGEAFCASGLHEDALEAFRKILADEPDDVSSLSGLAGSLLALRRTEEAVAALRRACEFEPSDPDLPMRLAEIFLQAGDGNQARVEMARALQLSKLDDAGIALRGGRILCSLKEYAEAAAVLAKALDRNPNSVPLLAELGGALLRSGKNAQAFEMFRRAGDLDPAQSSHPASAAEALRADGRKSAALAFLKKAVQIDPNNAALARRLAGETAAAGLIRESLPHYEQAMALAPADASLALEAAQAAFRAGDLEKADSWKEAGASAASATADGLVLQARIALEKGEPDKAAESCHRAVGDHPADARGWALLAHALALKEDRDGLAGRQSDDAAVAANSALAKAVELSAESPEALGLTGRAALILENYPAAIRCFESLCQSVPDDPDAHVMLAKASVLQEESAYRTRLVEGVKPEASFSSSSIGAARAALARAASLGAADEETRPLFERAALIDAQPDAKFIESVEQSNRLLPFSENFVAIAQAWLRFSDIERARKAAETAVHLQPEKEIGRTILGICEWKYGRRDFSLFSLREAIRLAPRRALPHAASAAVFFEMGRREEAAAEMREAVKLSPETAAWQHALGVWCEEIGDRAAALPCLQRAAELAPANGEYHRRFARALMRDGDPQTALVHFQQAAATLADDGGELSAEIGKAALESSRPAEAYEAYCSAQAKACARAPFAWQLGKARAALALGRRDEARATAKDVLDGEGHPPEARLILAEVEEAEGRLPEAIRHLDLAASEMSDPVLPALRLARLWTATGAAVRSCAAMQALLESHPENDEAHHLLAEALLDCSRLDDALRSAQKAAELAPRKAAHWILVGRVSRKMGQLDQSLAALAKAREIAPRDFLPALECGLTYEAEQRWDLALECYREGLKLAPENAELHYRMGVVHKNSRAYSDAADELRKAVQIEPHNLAAHRMLSGVMALSLVYGLTPQSADSR